MSEENQRGKKRKVILETPKKPEANKKPKLGSNLVINELACLTSV